MLAKDLSCTPYLGVTLVNEDLFLLTGKTTVVNGACS